MRITARVKGELEALVVLLAGIALALGALIGFTVAFARPLPAAAWAGLGIVGTVAMLLGTVAFVIVTRSDRASREPAERRVAPGDGVLRVLVVADEAIGSDRLRQEVCARVGECKSEVLVVAPALNTPIRHWTNEEDEAQTHARGRLDEELRILTGLGVGARGEVGADDPLQAVDDALRTFPADEIIISTHPRDRANWREEDAVSRLREAYGLPVTHVLVE